MNNYQPIQNIYDIEIMVSDEVNYGNLRSFIGKKFGIEEARILIRKYG